MVYKLTRDVKLMSTGFHRSAGRMIGENEIRDLALWKAWINEGVVVPAENKPAAVQPEIKEEAPLPQESGASPEEDVKDKQVRDMSDDELRKMARRLKLRGWHNMHRGTLIRKIEAQS